MTISTQILFAGVAATGLVLRLLPSLIQRRQGNDHWFWMLYVETVRETRRFPPRLPFMLDEQQWYPPLFPLLLAWLPESLSKRHARILAPAVDVLQLLLLMGSLYIVTGDPIVAAAAGGSTLAPLCIDYNYQLTPRGLAAFLLSGLAVTYFGYLQSGNVLLLVAVLGLGAAILLLHKMNTQMLVILLLYRGIICSDTTALLLIPATMLAAWLVSGGFYWKVLTAHADIVTFWNRHWRELNVHQYDDSPLYGKGTPSGRHHHLGGWKGLVRHARNILAVYPAAIPVAGLLLMHAEPLTDFQTFCLHWMIAAYGWAAATSWIPRLRCLGAGVYYAYNAVFPAAALGASIALENGTVGLTALGAAGALCLLVILRILKRKRRVGSSAAPTDDLAPLLDVLAKQPDGSLYCIPIGLSDRVAYQTRRPTLWGAHGYGFRRLETFFPVMQVSIEQLLREHGIRYVLVNRDYLDERDAVRELDTWRLLAEHGTMRLYETPYAEVLPSSERVPAALESAAG